MSAKPTKSKTVVLRLSSAALKAFPHDTTPAPAPESKPASSPDTPAPQTTVDQSTADTPADSASVMNGTSTPSSLAVPGAAPNGKRKGPVPKKRTLATANGADAGTPKPRGKPGPKKKQKLGDAINDPNNKSPFAGGATVQKLGPKANAGAINANLRSLDRTGKKCRKWEKKGLKLRSFTGVVWEVPTYSALARSAMFSEDVKSDSTGSTDTKLKDESSAISEKSGMNGNGSTPLPPAFDDIASSPAPIAAAS